MNLLKTATMQVVSDCTSMQDKTLSQLHIAFTGWKMRNCYHLAAIVAAYAQGKYGITAWQEYDKQYIELRQGISSLFNNN